MNPETIIQDINAHCEAGRYFRAAGIVKDTMRLWQSEALFNRLHDIARIMVITYKKERDNA
jgi:hypothetical protein